MAINIGGAGIQPGVYTGTGGADTKMSTGVKPATATTVLDSPSLVGTGSGKTAGTPTAGLQAPGSSAGSATAQAKLTAGLAAANADLGADTNAMMALFQKLAQEMRGAARETRSTEMSNQVTQLKSTADEMRAAAQDRLAGAMVSGAVQIGAGAMSSAGGMAIAGGMAGGLKTQMDKTQTQIQNDKAAAGSLKAEMQTETKTGAVKNASDMMDQMMDVIRDVREKLVSIQQSSAETIRAIGRTI